MDKDEKIQKLEEENNKLKEQLNKYLLHLFAFQMRKGVLLFHS